MRAVTTITARALPLDRNDVDTDQIIPASWLKRVERTGFGQGLFSEWRKDPSFVFNDERFAGAEILIAGSGFGIGSSREHAVWALEDYGFKAVVAQSFSDIFRNNCTKVGIVPVVVDAVVGAALLDQVTTDPSTQVTIDLANRQLTCGAAGVDVSFAIDDFTQYRLLNGLDDIGLTLQHEADITAYELRTTTV